MPTKLGDIDYFGQGGAKSSTGKSVTGLHKNIESGTHTLSTVVDPFREITANALGDDPNTVQGQVGGALKQMDPSMQMFNPGPAMDLLFGGIENTFQPSMPNITPGFSQEQLNTSYNQSQSGLAAQQNLLNALQAQQGIQNQSDILGQQQGLANQLGMQAQGYGPNPALAQLQQATQANTANQAALMAGQRGAGANAGLIARQAAMQGASNQQQMVGQAATMRAQQQIAAQQALAQQQASMQQTAGNQVGQLSSGQNAYNTAALNQQQMLLNANSQYNNAMVNATGNANTIGANISMANQAANKGILGGVMGAVGSVFGMASGGMVPQYADGGMVDPNSSGLYNLLNNNMAQSSAMASGNYNQANLNSPQASPEFDKGMANLGQGLGKMFSSMSSGGGVPGQAPKSGDHSSNDTVPAMLSPGEIVIPRSVVQSKNAPDAAKKFVAALLAKQGIKGMSNGGYVSDSDRLKQDIQSNGERREQQPFHIEEPSYEEQQRRREINARGKGNYRNSLTQMPAGMSYQHGGFAGEPEEEPIMSYENNAVLTPYKSQPQAEEAIPQNAYENVSIPQIPTNPRPGPQTPMPVESAGARYKAGLQQEAVAEGAMGKQEATASQNYAEQIANLNTEYQKNASALMDERKKVQNDFMSGKIDAHRLWHDKTGAQKTMTAIGLILGGIGSGMTGGPNVALDFLNKQIDRDIDAQVKNMDKKHNMMSALHEQYGDLRSAVDMAKVIKLDEYKMQLAKIASQSKDPTAKARALQLGARWDAMTAPLMSSIAQRKTLQSATANGQMTPEVAIQALPKEQQSEAIKALSEYKEIISGRNAAVQGVQDQYNLNTVGNRISHPISSKEQIATARLAPFTLAKPIFGNMSETEKSTFDEAMNVGMSTNEASLNQKKKVIHSLVQPKLDAAISKLKTMGISLPQDVSPRPLTGAKPRK